MKLGRLDVRIDMAGSRVVLVGRIDDSCQLSEIAPQLPAGTITIDTEGVTFVNSVDMREWVRLLRALRERGSVVLERVADVLMTPMNLLTELAGIPIHSFHAQYACNACGAESAPLVDAVVHRAELVRMQAPKLPCPECGTRMELADFPERYLTIFRGG